MLQLLLWAKKELSLNQLVDALAIRQSGQGLVYDPDNRMPLPREIIKMLPALIVIYEKDSPQPFDTVLDMMDRDGCFQSDSSLSVRFAHYTVKEHMNSKRVLEPYKSSLGMLSAHVAIVAMVWGHSVVRGRQLATFQILGLAQALAILAQGPFSLLLGKHLGRSCWVAQHNKSSLERIVDFLRNEQVPGNPFLVCIRFTNQYFPEPKTEITNPLYYAINAGFDDIVLRLLEHDGRTIEITSDELSGGLEIAVDTLCLLEQDMEPLHRLDSPESEIMDPPTQVLASSRSRVIRGPLERGAKPTLRSFVYAVSYRKDQLLQILLDNDAPLEDMRWPSMVRRSEGRTFVLLLRYGADVNLPNHIGCTPLMQVAHGNPDLRAAENHSARIIQTLSDSHADMDVKDYCGNTALHAATKNRFPNSETIIQLLLRNGANPCIRNDKGLTALDMVRNDSDEDGNHLILLLLLQAMWAQKAGTQIAARKSKKKRPRGLLHDKSPPSRKAKIQGRQLALTTVGSKLMTLEEARLHSPAKPIKDVTPATIEYDVNLEMLDWGWDRERERKQAAWNQQFLPVLTRLDPYISLPVPARYDP
ncbi:hypothetical protein E4T42_05970 [Aureobasidium subglaciale]|nr:hypothetical protein E4T42_05970 [Aureobasidium subglaciale]